MGLLDQVLKDVRTLTFNSGLFEQPLKFTNPAGDIFEINGLAMVHSVDADINNSSDFVAIGTGSTITFSETDLVNAGAVIRRGKDLNMLEWIVEFDLPRGHVTALIDEPYPDETFAVIRANITTNE